MFVVDFWYHKGVPRSERGNIFPSIQCFDPELNLGDRPRIAMTFSSSYST
jgi:hypothetical protein